MRSSSVVIAARFRGPPTSANGGYTAGLLARELGGCVEVTLRRPPPLERELLLEQGDGAAKLKHEGELIAEARVTSIEFVTPAPAPSFEQASERALRYVGHTRHEFPTCFVCGPSRAPGDGLRIFPGSEAPNEPVAAPWVPSADLAAGGDSVAGEFVWAALDCPGYFGAASPAYPTALLGRIAGQLLAPVRTGERCVIVGFGRGREGRKLYAGSALYGEDGTLRARTQQTWITVSEA